MTKLTKKELKVRAQIESLEAALMSHSEELGLVVGDSEMFPL